jgi:hypothetical protein
MDYVPALAPVSVPVNNHLRLCYGKQASCINFAVPNTLYCGECTVPIPAQVPAPAPALAPVNNPLRLCYGKDASCINFSIPNTLYCGECTVPKPGVAPSPPHVPTSSEQQERQDGIELLIKALFDKR